ncbi:MAG TPA: hypothetical protein PKC18_11905 [Lacipirellulaceae bacterium]|nr:hypothetical protein [Lacipirellulaceae bacterium]HMP05310.1 hypothetical protein [Lacipirellulaceae bacterium]
MGRLAEFLRTGSLGPVTLGMSPFDVTEQIGEPDQESQKKNPLTLKFGSLQLVFWKHSKQGNSELRDISISFFPNFVSLPQSVALDDFPGSMSEADFDVFITNRQLPAAHLIGDEGNRQYTFLSGVLAIFSGGQLDTVRIAQKEKREIGDSTLSDVREPTRDQILEMVREADLAAAAGAIRAALLVAWAGMEAALRKAALRAGRHGQIGVQPSILIRELFSTGIFNPDEVRQIEELRQIRTASAHGLAPSNFDPKVIAKINNLTRVVLTNATSNVRKRKQVDDLFPIEAVEAYSVVVRESVSAELFSFLTSRGLRGSVDRGVIGGNDPHDAIIISKESGSFEDLTHLVNEWKEKYVNG